MSGEQIKPAEPVKSDPIAAHLAGIDAQVRQEPAAPGATQQQAGPSPEDQEAAALAENVAENESLLELAFTVLEPMAPTVVAPFTAERRSKIAAALAAVERKRGFSIAGMFAGWMEEIALCLAVAKPAMEAAKEYRRMKDSTPAAIGNDAPAVAENPRHEPIVTEALKPREQVPHDGASVRELVPAT